MWVQAAAAVKGFVLMRLVRKAKYRGRPLFLFTITEEMKEENYKINFEDFRSLFEKEIFWKPNHHALWNNFMNTKRVWQNMIDYLFNFIKQS